MFDDIGKASSDEDSSNSSSDESIFELNELDSKQISLSSKVPNTSSISAKQSITQKRLFKKALQPKRTIIPRNVSKALKKKSVKAKLHLTPQLARKKCNKKTRRIDNVTTIEKKQTRDV